MILIPKENCDSCYDASRTVLTEKSNTSGVLIVFNLTISLDECVHIVLDN